MPSSSSARPECRVARNASASGRRPGARLASTPYVRERVQWAPRPHPAAEEGNLARARLQQPVEAASVSPSVAITALGDGERWRTRPQSALSAVDLSAAGPAQQAARPRWIHGDDGLWRRVCRVSRSPVAWGGRRDGPPAGRRRSGVWPSWLHPDAPTVHLHERPADGQPQPAAPLYDERGAGLVEGLEHLPAPPPGCRDRYR